MTELPQTIDDLTHAELLKYVHQAGIRYSLSRAVLIGLRHESLSAAALVAEKKSQAAWAAWMDAVKRRSDAHDVAMAAKGEARRRAAEASYLAIAREAHDLENRRNGAERAARRARAAAEAAWAAGEKEASL